MLFVNISSNEIKLSNKAQNYMLIHKNLERTLPKLLSDIYKDEFCSDILIINGPGAFTSLRIGALCLNMLNFLHKNQINLWSISKIDLFNFFVQKGDLPSNGLIYIGQKKKMWLYDFEKASNETIFIDDIINLSLDYFVDDIYGDLRSNFSAEKTLEISLDSDLLKLKINGKEFQAKLSEFLLEKTYSIEANYMIKPNISKSKK